MTDFERWMLLLSAITAALGVWGAVVLLFRTRKQIQAQFEAQFFAEYTRRYQDIMMQLPQSMVLDRSDLTTLSDDAERGRVVGLFAHTLISVLRSTFLPRRDGSGTTSGRTGWMGSRITFK